MKIVTVNIPESYLESIERLIGEDGLYPSRSELIRCAVRDFLIKELKRANEMIKFKEVKVEELDDKNFVRVPIEKMDENNEPVFDDDNQPVMEVVYFPGAEGIGGITPPKPNTTSHSLLAFLPPRIIEQSDAVLYLAVAAAFVFVIVVFL